MDFKRFSFVTLVITGFVSMPLQAALIYSSAGLPVGASAAWSAPVSSINLTAIGDVGPARTAFSSGFAVNLTFTTPLQFKFATDQSSGASGIPGGASGLVFRTPSGTTISSSGPLTSLGITTSFPSGFAPSSTSGSPINRGVSSSIASPSFGTNSRLAYEFRFDPQNSFTNGAATGEDAPADSTLTYSGTYRDGSNIDFTSVAPSPPIGSNVVFSYNQNLSGVVANFRDSAGFSGFNGAVDGAPTIVGGNAVFTNATSSADGFGVALVDNPNNADNIALNSLTTTVTPGASADFPALTRFRLSLDGGAVVIPEPSSLSLIFCFGSLFLLRRR